MQLIFVVYFRLSFAGGLDVSKVSAWKEPFLQHGSNYISAASVAIALMAFFLTIQNARLDRQYKSWARLVCATFCKSIQGAPSERDKP
jgi:hypothetical protein